MNKIINYFEIGITSISAISSILLIVLVIRELKKNYKRKNLLGMDLSKYIITIAIYDLLFELAILISNFFTSKQNSEGPICKTFEFFLTFGVMGEYVSTPFISLCFWGKLSGRLNVRFPVYLLVSIFFSLLQAYLFGW